MTTVDKGLSYKDAGVDIDAGNALVERIKGVAKETKRPEVLAGLGGFGALFQINTNAYKEPVLVSATDGVGTKLKLAMALDKHDSLGIDLVAMCVNDLIVCGAEPLFFLDYYATGKLNVEAAAQVIQGIGEGCKQAGAALIGGETAEMPGVYQNDDYDMAGFCVGVVDKSSIIDGSQVKVGDKLIGIGSSGPHSNGYSLIRKIIENNNIDINSAFADSTLGLALLAPTKIYVKSILQLIRQVSVHAIAHITGGGLLENIPRVLPNNCQATLDKNSWEIPEIFNWIQSQGNIAQQEMYRTFNCGIGMVLCVPEQDVENTLAILQHCGEQAMLIGEIETQQDAEQQVVIQ